MKVICINDCTLIGRKISGITKGKIYDVIERRQHLSRQNINLTKIINEPKDITHFIEPSVLGGKKITNKIETILN